MTKRHAWYVLLILSAINFLNYVDRQIIITLGPFIRRDLHLTLYRIRVAGAPGVPCSFTR